MPIIKWVGELWYYYSSFSYTGYIFCREHFNLRMFIKNKIAFSTKAPPLVAIFLSETLLTILLSGNEVARY